MVGYNWGEHMVNQLLKSLDGFSAQDLNTLPGGDINFLVIHFLDMIDLPHGTGSTIQPTC
ncbi:hypothetical protein LINPERPRIM_LOCUS26346, partial [Linum perenne]